MEAYHEAKLFVEHAVSIEHGTLHVLIGMLAWLAIALLSGRAVSSWFPWSALLVLEIWNEAVDLWVEQWPHPGMQYGEGAKDLILTMLLPTIFLAVARIRPAVLKEPSSLGDMKQDETSDDPPAVGSSSRSEP